jgi:hypothetical protein
VEISQFLQLGSDIGAAFKSGGRSAPSKERGRVKYSEGHKQLLMLKN